MMSTVDEALSSGVLTYVGFDRDSSLPGRHPGRIEDPELRQRVVDLVAEVDAVRPGEDARDLFAWAESRRAEVATAHPELSDEALIALRALISFEWR
jgi:hypothetical protein